MTDMITVSRKEITEKDARITELELENKQTKEAIATLNADKPLGEIVGLHTAQLQLIKIEALQACEKVLVEALDSIAKVNHGSAKCGAIAHQALANVRGE